jgi:hypothetical protein
MDVGELGGSLFNAWTRRKEMRSWGLADLYAALRGVEKATPAPFGFGS